MKNLFRIIIAMTLSILVIVLLPAQVFADSVPDYISEVKVYYDSYDKAKEEGYTILKDSKGNPVDLNQDAGGGWGSEGDRAVYLGYKTTSDSKEAITDLALMNMKGGYSTQDYDALMDRQIKSQIIPFVDSFIVALDEYRVNYDPESGCNKQRADYIHDALNKLTDDDCGGKGLGDLLLNSTKYEMGDEAYNKLSAEEKKEHADIVTIIAQANGRATLLLEDLLTRACDANRSNWIERFSQMTYDDLIDSTGLAPTDAARTLARRYDDAASEILDMWDTFRNQLLKADEAAEKLEETDTDEMDENSEIFKNFDLETATDEDAVEVANASVEAEINTEIFVNRVSDFIAKEYLSEIEYGDGTMFDFFTQEKEEIEDDITVLYPLVAALSEGQRAGLEFITLSTLVTIAGTSDSYYSDSEIDKLSTVSVYEGVDRDIYKKGGVALTSDTLRKDAAALAVNEDSNGFPFSWWALVTGTFAVASAAALVYTYRYSRTITAQIKSLEASIASANTQMENFSTLCNNVAKDARNLIGPGKMSGSQYQEMFLKMQNQRFEMRAILGKQNREAAEEIERLSARSATCNKLMIGLGVAVVILTAITVWLSWEEMKDFYKVDFSPVPRYMIEAKDLIGYNKKGEKVVLKNQSAYYKAVQSNAKKGDFKFNEIGTAADMNACVGKQWLALYAVKNELMDPILASSLLAVVGNKDIPSGYQSGIHMFGSGGAFNLNSSLYDWDNDGKITFVYFKTGERKTTSEADTAASFSNGSVALSGGVGIVIGAVATVAVIRAKRKQENN